MCLLKSLGAKAAVEALLVVLNILIAAGFIIAIYNMNHSPFKTNNLARVSEIIFIAGIVIIGVLVAFRKSIDSNNQQILILIVSMFNLFCLILFVISRLPFLLSL